MDIGLIAASLLGGGFLAYHWIRSDEGLKEGGAAIVIGLFAIAGERIHHYEDIIALRTSVAADVSTLLASLIDLEAPKMPPIKDLGEKDNLGVLERIQRTANLPVPAQSASAPISAFTSTENYFDLYGAVAQKIGDLEAEAVGPVNRFYTDLKLVRDLTRNLAAVQQFSGPDKANQIKFRIAELADMFHQTICDAASALKSLHDLPAATAGQTDEQARLSEALGRYPAVLANFKELRGGQVAPCPVLKDWEAQSKAPVQ